ncbi:MAG: hypothetical protein WBZ51_39265, partial [Xanthobacteraceae bacterium]
MIQLSRIVLSHAHRESYSLHPVKNYLVTYVLINKLPRARASECPQSAAEADIRAVGGSSVFDPSPTLAVHRSNGFDARIEPYH